MKIEKKTIKKKIYYPLVMCLILLLIIPVDQVNAASLPFYTDLRTSNFAVFNNCNSLDGCPTVKESYSGELYYIDTGSRIGWTALTTDTVQLYTYGIQLGFSVDTPMIADYLYSVSAYVCTETQGMTLDPLKITTGNSQAVLRDYSSLPKYSVEVAVNNVEDSMYTTSESNMVLTCGYMSYFVVPSVRSQYIGIQFTSGTKDISTRVYYLGYTMEALGKYNVATKSEVESIIKNSGFATSKSVEEVQKSVDEVQSQLNSLNSSIDEQTKQDQEQHEEELKQDQEQHDEIMNSDISSSDKELPNDEKYQDYSKKEDELKDKMLQANLDTMAVGLDEKTSFWLWDTLTKFIQSNSLIFGMFISILSIGIIKLALGR